MADESLDVHLDRDGQTVQVGVAYFHRRAAITTSFTYTASFLADRASFAIDPHLPLTTGALYTDGLPGAFQDCAPDRWGRNLVAKRLRADFGATGNVQPTPSDVDFLVGVSDLTRQGALRFTKPGDSVFVHPEVSVPKLVALPRLLNAADRVADDDLTAIRELLDAGSGSLGGARPKASVIDGEDLLLAKFPHRGDEWDIMSWEKTALDLAELAGIPTPAHRLVQVGGRNVLLLRRFDRAGSRRIPYISAMTFVAGRDGDAHDYSDIAEYLPDYGSNVGADLAELFRRAVFNVAIHNTDDHLRNHGFMYAAAGWQLSPVFDVNPNPDLGAIRQTTIGAAGRVDEELDGLGVLADECRLGQEERVAIIAAVLSATARWRDVATANGIDNREQRLFAGMFEHQQSLLRPSVPQTHRRAQPRSKSTPRSNRGSYGPKVDGAPPA